MRVRDGGSPQRSSTTTVAVQINRNLNAPVFDLNAYGTTILETQSPGTVVQFSTPIVARDNDIQVCNINSRIKTLRL